MENWDLAASSPSVVKFEASPAESFLSMPGEPYPSLFAPTTTNAAAGVSPLDTMTPPSDDRTDAGAASPASPPASGEKKTKKRKSWGQVLPEPKTNLPPRKRAKTEDEKEQRRVERVLRNRRAAQSSRERKRLEVEALEQKNQELQARIDQLEHHNSLLLQHVKSVGSVPGAKNPITLSQDLFSPQNTQTSQLGLLPLDNSWDLMELNSTTINPESLSPALSPVSEADFEDDQDEPELSPASPAAVEATQAQKISPDLTQHPAAVLCDLQCQSAEISRSWATSQQRLSPALALYCQLTLLLTCTSTLLSLIHRPLTQIALSLRANLSLAPTPALLNTIILLVTRSSASSTLTTSSTPTRLPLSRSTRRSPTLRIKVLRKLLACSPMLARPLMDATVVALRLVNSEESSDVLRAGGADVSAAKSWASGISADGEWLDTSVLPSKELLLTLLWAINVESKNLEAKSAGGSSGALPGSGLKTLKRKTEVDVQHGVGRRNDYEMNHVGGKRRKV